MLFLAIEHCNGEIMDDPFLISSIEQLNDLKNGPYLIYQIDLFDFSVIELKNLSL